MITGFVLSYSRETEEKGDEVDVINSSVNVEEELHFLSYKINEELSKPIRPTLKYFSILFPSNV